VGGVGALTPSGFEPLALTANRQEGIEQALVGAPRDQPGAKLTSHRTVKAGIGQLQTQGLLPIDATSHGVGALAVG
jgi:hypothetical protein